MTSGIRKVIFKNMSVGGRGKMVYLIRHDVTAEESYKRSLLKGKLQTLSFYCEKIFCN